MTGYYFHFSDSDGAGFQESRVFDDVEAACKEATRELSFMMSSRLPDGSERQFKVQVTDEGGRIVFEAELAYTSRSPGRS